MSQTDTFSQSSGYIADAAMGDDATWTEYDADVIASYFQKKPILLARRLFQTVFTLGSWFGMRWIDSKFGSGDDTFKKRAAQLRQRLVKLGPAFVKIAQAVSSRPDVIPSAYLEELSLLQDRIAPFSTELALNIIEKELGVPVEILFSEISPQPVAAASLGQVYEARLRPSGVSVAVKVQRPGVAAAVALDVCILRIMAGVARRAGNLNTDLQAVVDEWATSLFKEMDYQAEARNGIRFKKLFGELPDVVVPKMYPELTSQRVLIMEWIEGQRLSEVSDLRLVEVGVYCSLTQLLDSGFYHADPHPGNLLKTPDGKLAYLDFGMMGEIKQDLREALIEASVHLVNREYDYLAGDFVNLGLLPPTEKLDVMATALTGVFQSAISKGVRNISFGDLSTDLGKTMYKFKFRIPAYFSLVVRSLTVLEGIALSSDRDYKVLSSSYPWIARKVLTDQSPSLRNTLKQLIYKEGRFRFDRLESLLSESVRPMFGANLVLSSQQEEDEKRESLRRVLKFALGPEGEFIRETLVDEVAKGVDAYNRALFDALSISIATNLPFTVPRPASLLDDEDRIHLDNLRRLSSLLLQGSLSTESSDVYYDEDDSPTPTWNDFLTLLQKAPGILQSLPALTVISELPLPAQQAALSLPVSLAGKVTSRILARTIRSSIPRSMSPPLLESPAL